MIKLYNLINVSGPREVIFYPGIWYEVAVLLSSSLDKFVFKDKDKVVFRDEDKGFVYLWMAVFSSLSKKKRGQ